MVEQAGKERLLHSLSLLEKLFCSKDIFIFLPGPGEHTVTALYFSHPSIILLLIPVLCRILCIFISSVPQTLSHTRNGTVNLQCAFLRTKKKKSCQELLYKCPCPSPTVM